jgi:hypothetical protein
LEGSDSNSGALSAEEISKQKKILTGAIIGLITSLICGAIVVKKYLERFSRDGFSDSDMGDLVANGDEGG